MNRIVGLRLWVALPVLLLCPLWGAAAAAQICAGRQTFNAAPVQAGARVRASSSAAVLSGNLGFGTNTLFGVVSGSRTTAEESRGQYSLEALFGSDQPMTVDNRVHFCPVLGLGYRWPDGGGEGRGAVARAALHISRLAVNRHERVVAPTAALELVWEPDAAGRRETAAIASGGVGVLFRSGFSVQAGLGVRLGTRRREPVVVLEGRYGF